MTKNNTHTCACSEKKWVSKRRLSKNRAKGPEARSPRGQDVVNEERKRVRIVLLTALGRLSSDGLSPGPPPPPAAKDPPPLLLLLPCSGMCVP